MEIIEYEENYFRSVNCEYVSVDVFDHNEQAINFYKKQGYHTRMLIDIKKYKDKQRLICKKEI